MAARNRQDVVVTPGLIVAKAAEYLGTPFQHQARLKGVAVDCVGLLAGVASELGLPHEDFLSYSMMPTESILEDHLEKAGLEKISEPEHGCVATFWWRSPKEPAYHVAILDTAKGHMIHTSNYHGQVVRHRFDQRWIKRVKSYWRYPWRR